MPDSGFIQIKQYLQIKLFFKFRCNIFQKLAYTQMLGAYLLAFSTLHAVGCFSVLHCMYVMIVIVGIPVVKYLLGVQTGNKVGNQNLLGTDVRTVFASRAASGASLFRTRITKR